MYPNIPLNIVKFIGNSAGAGAKMALISSGIRDEALNILKEIEYVELSTYPKFMEAFLKSTFIPYKEDLGFPIPQ